MSSPAPDPTLKAPADLASFEAAAVSIRRRLGLSKSSTAETTGPRDEGDRRDQWKTGSWGSTCCFCFSSLHAYHFTSPLTVSARGTDCGAETI
jgi:hypothetical protein